VTAVSVAAALGASPAAAQIPLPNVFDGGNRWLITGFIDNSPSHQEAATQEICFLPYAVVGTSIQGAWFSTSFTNWNGRYYQEGDEIKMIGDYADDVGHDHMTLVHTTFDVAGQVRGLAFKDWTEWREDGRFGRIIGWANARIVRAGRCGLGDMPFPTTVPVAELPKLEEAAARFSLQVPERLTLRGLPADAPHDAELEDIDVYFERTGQAKNRK
jgi:hypothetical protein